MMSTIPQEPREIAFGDIKKGDDIEVVRVHGDLTTTSRGIAHRRAVDGWWETSQGKVLALDAYHPAATIYLHSRPAPAEPTGLGAVIRWRGWEYIATNSTPGTQRWIWVDEDGEDNCPAALRWDEFAPDTVEVLS